MRLIFAVSVAAVVVATAGLSLSPAWAQSCQDLWTERNGYYKDFGYCFKTRRAIEFFGNQGCRFTFEGDIPFPQSVRARINQIVRAERALGCSG